MRRLILFLCLLANPSYAICTAPSFYDGFSGQFFATPTYTPKTIGFVYGLDETTLYVTFYNGSYTEFSNIPQQVPTQFLYSSNPDTFYTAEILNIYTEISTCGSPPLG